MSTAKSNIYICSGIRWTNDYIHTPYFATIDEQSSYFASKVVKTFTDYTYLRRNWSIKVAGSMSEAQAWNYLYFQNYRERTYFYFITEVKYISDETVELVLEMDVMQTYAFEYVLHTSFVDREHSFTDNVGDNTIDEGLELGELENISVTEIEELKAYYIMTMATVDMRDDTFPDTMGGLLIDNVYTGCDIYACKHAAYMENKLSNMGNKIDGVMSIWMYPSALVDAGVGNLIENSIELVQGTKSFEHHINTPSKLKTYEPKNKKLLTYPYRYLYVSNNIGNNAVYRYERFGSSDVLFDVMGSVFPDGGVKLMPRNYNGIPYNHEESLTLTGFPTCAWDSDAYKIWLAQNQSQNAVKLVSAGASILGGIAMMATGAGSMVGGGMIAGGVSSIATHLARQSDMDAQPPQARGTQSASVNACNSQLTFSFYHKAITEERAKIIDDFFTMYGYKTNRVKIPNKNARENFTYTKTIGCHVSGRICNDDLRKIQSVYDNGVTFWNDPDVIGDYTVSNKPKGA